MPDSLVAEPNATVSEARRAARNAGALLIANLISKGSLFAWQLILAPWLGTLAYGVYGTVGALTAIGASVASFSMGLIVIRDVARDHAAAGRYWSALLVAQTFLAMLAYGLVNGAALSYDDAIRAYAALASLNIIIDVFGNMSHDLLVAREKMLPTSAVEVGHIALRIVLAALGLSLGYGLLSVYGAAILTGLGRVLLLSWLNWRDGIRPQFPVDAAILRPLLRNSAPLALTSFLVLAYQHADKLMTTGIIGAAQTGYLTAAFVLNFGVVEIISTTLLVATYPLLARYAQENAALFGVIVEKLALFMLVVSLPIALTLSLYAEAITVPLFGAAFQPTAGILSILIWYTLLTMLGNVLTRGLLVQNRQRLILVIRVTGLLGNIALNAFLLWRFRDPRGAALASVIAEAVILLLLFLSFKAPGLAWRRNLPRVAMLLLVATAMALCLLLLREVWPLGLLLAGLIYLGGLIFTPVFAPSDWDLLYRLVAAMPGGGLIRRFWRREVALNW